MDFNDTPEEAEFRAKARAFLDANAELRTPEDPPPDLIGQDEPDAIRDAKRWQGLKADNGWACLTWPEEFGGQGATPIQSVIYRQEEARYRTPVDIFLIGLGMLGPTIMAHGTAEQKDRHILKMLRGEEVWCQLFSEPAAGSDLAGLRTSAVKDGDEWILNGQKIWTTGAQFSEWGMIVTRSDPTAAKHAGLTYFIVDMKSPGVEVRPIRQINGRSHFSEVFFTDVRVPDSNVLGGVGNGWAVAITTLMHERASIGGGRGGNRVDDLIRAAQENELNGRPAIEDSSVRQRIAEMYVRLSGIKYTGYRTLTALSRGQTPGPESSIGKLVGAPLGQQMAALGIELEGLAGSVMDGSPPWQEAYLASPGIRIAGGTDEILRNIIAERVLRLPPEPRMDKKIPFRDIPTGPPGS